MTSPRPPTLTKGAASEATKSILYFPVLLNKFIVINYTIFFSKRTNWRTVLFSVFSFRDNLFIKIQNVFINIIPRHWSSYVNVTVFFSRFSAILGNSHLCSIVNKDGIGLLHLQSYYLLKLF